MSKIHYFQRYSSKENTVTNNTLQFLERIYSYSPSKASQFLADLTGEPIDIGIEINQQGRDNGAIPDGQVIQRSFKVLIESKVDTPPDTDQLLRHSKTFSGEEQKILLLLTKIPLEPRESDDIKRRISERHPGVLFKGITYENICEAANALFKEYEYEMCDLVNDYNEYCNDTGLFDQSRYLMRIMPSNASFEMNIRHGIYFRLSDQGYTKHQFTGIYTARAVVAIWKNDSIFDVDYRDGELKKILVEGRETNDYDEKLVRIIEDAKRAYRDWPIEVGHRFFCGESRETNYVKSSPGGIPGPRLVNLRRVIEDFDELDVEGIAQRLREKRWE